MEIVRTDFLMKSTGCFRLGPVHLQLSPGEVLGIMGPNGAGKTTLLKILWGFIRPSSGTVAVFDLAPHLHQPESSRKRHDASRGPLHQQV